MPHGSSSYLRPGVCSDMLKMWRVSLSWVLGETLKYLTKDKGRHQNSPQLNHEVLYFILPTFPLRADELWLHVKNTCWHLFVILVPDYKGKTSKFPIVDRKNPAGKYCYLFVKVI